MDRDAPPATPMRYHLGQTVWLRDGGAYLRSLAYARRAVHTRHFRLDVLRAWGFACSARLPDQVKDAVRERIAAIRSAGRGQVITVVRPRLRDAHNPDAYLYDVRFETALGPVIERFPAQHLDCREAQTP